MLPRELSKILVDAEKSVLAHQNGELILPIKRDIWRQLGAYEVTDEKPVVHTIGLKRRTKLAVLCVEHVISFWNVTAPMDNIPQVLLKMIDDYFNGKVNEEHLRKMNSRYWTNCEDLDSEGDFSIARFVGFASIKAANTALVDQSLLSEDIAKDVLDDDLDPYSWDTSYFAAMAYSDGAPWEEESSIPKRREFWLWYLEKAVLLAYEDYR